jgi:hypothetical protein
MTRCENCPSEATHYIPTPFGRAHKCLTHAHQDASARCPAFSLSHGDRLYRDLSKA